MRKRRVIILAVAFVAVLGLIWWVVASQPPDPVYDGHPLSYWLTSATRTNANAVYSESELIHSSLDSNAVPYLVQALKTRDGTLRMAYSRVWPHLPAWLKQRMPYPKSAASARSLCCILLGDLKTAARPAIPELVRLLREDENDVVRGRAAADLGRIANGKDKMVVEALLAAAKDKSSFVRAGTALAFGSISNGEDNPVVEALLAATKDADPNVSGFAAAALWHLNPEAAAKAGLTNAISVTWTTTNSGPAVR